MIDAKPVPQRRRFGSRRVQLVAGLALAAAIVVGTGGCTTVSYYSQAIAGHLEVMQRARPIDDRLARDALPDALRARLFRALEIRDFATRELGLPDNGSYRSYADLGRPFVIWNVVAAPALSIVPKASCFPVAGCVSYRGFYGEADARAYAASLEKEGLDVFVHGVAAYSTLGWFDDPLLNTFINYPEAELARLVFHELAHQTVYIRDDTTFNESFAVAVEEAGVERWLASHPETDRAAYATLQSRRAEFLALVMRYRERLGALYASSVPDADKLAGKRQAFADMQADYRRLRDSWGGWAGYDRWFARDINNAHLASIATYTRLVPAFRALLARGGGDFGRFYAAVREIGALPPAAREARLAALAPPGASAGALR